MTREEAMERIEFRIKRHCIEANEDSGGKCGECWRYPCNDMKAFLSINEERPHGEWKKDGFFAICSECGHELQHYELVVSRLNFCPNCGADMREESEQILDEAVDGEGKDGNVKEGDEK